jgi:hypothetical protein
MAPHRRSLYPIFATAAQRWTAGEELYRRESEAYRYSPAVAAFFVPFGLLPDGPANVLWRLLGAAAFLGGLAWWSRAVLPAHLSRTVRALLFVLAAPLAVGNLHNGQANLHVIGLMLLAAAAVARERFTLAAAAIAVATLFKIYPIALGLLFVVLYPRRLGVRLALALAVGLLVPFLLQRPDYVAGQYAGWLRHLERNDRQLLEPQLWYRDLRLLCRVWIAPLGYQSYQVVEAVAGAALAGLALLLKRAGAPRRWLINLLLGLACCWMTVLGPATESATYALLSPVAAWLILSAFTGEHPLLVRGLFVAGVGFLVFGQATAVIAGAKPLQLLGPQPFGGLLLMLGLLLTPLSLVPGRRAAELVPVNTPS